jgi:hypothetical protein
VTVDKVINAYVDGALQFGPSRGLLHQNPLQQVLILLEPRVITMRT